MYEPMQALLHMHACNLSAVCHPEKGVSHREGGEGGHNWEPGAPARSVFMPASG